MADITIHKKEIAVRKLAAEVITLYPTRAHVVRSIKDLSLKVSFIFSMRYFLD